MRSAFPGIEAPTLEMGKEQPQYLTVTAALVKHPSYSFVRCRMEDGSVVEMNTLLYCFRPTDQERVLLAAGEPLYLGLLTQGKAPQPVLLEVGHAAVARTYSVSVLVDDLLDQG